MIVSERYDATVTKIDEKQPAFIKVKCSGLLDDEETELPMWVRPVMDWSWFYVPDIGEQVEVEVVTGSREDEIEDQMSIDNLDIQWRGKRHYTAEEVDEKSGAKPRTIHPDFTSENYGKRRGFATPIGHIFLFDDTEGKTKIYLTWVKEKDNTTDISTILLDSDGTIKHSIFGGKHSTHLRDNEWEVKLDEGKHTILLKENEISITLDEGVGATITGKDADATTVLGDGGVKAAIADHLKTLWDNNKSKHSDVHKHPTAFGPSGPADVAAEAWDSAIESSKLTFPDG